MTSNLDPFTQKLLERTQARKQLRDQNKIKDAGSGLRSPLKETTNSQPESNHEKPAKKRQSSEGIDSSFEKKSRFDEEEPAFTHRTGIHGNYVVPSTTPRSPTKTHSAGSSLKSRLASLNQHYNEQYEIDMQEINRKEEAEKLKVERELEHKRIVEAERAKQIQEKIFGKGKVPTSTKTQQVQKSSQEKSASKGSYVKVTASVQQEPKPPMKKNVASIPSTTQKKPISKNNIDSTTPSTEKKAFDLAKNHSRETAFYKETSKEQEYTKRKNEIIQARNKAIEEEKLNSASVGDKKSIFEEKMKREKEARGKEIETEKRLKQNVYRKASAEKTEETPMEVDSKKPESVKKTGMMKHVRTAASKNTPTVTKTSAKTTASTASNVVSSENQTKPVKSSKSEAANVNGSPARQALEGGRKEKKLDNIQSEKIDSPKGEITAILNNINADLSALTKPTKELPKPILLQEIKSPSKETEAFKAYSEMSTKDFSGDINSPQPVDYTENTEMNTFDISAMLLEAAHEDTITSPQKFGKFVDKTPHRSSTMRNPQLEGPLIKAAPIDIDLTPVQMEDDESLSEFAKQIRQKKNEIKTDNFQDKLTNIDAKVDQNARSKYTPQKPPRNARHSVHATKHLPTYEEFLEGKQIVPIETENAVKQTKLSENGAGTLPDNYRSPNQLAVCDSNDKKRKKMRRSHSFSEGQTTPVKSGYNKQSSKKYNAQTFDKPDIVYSKRERIQNLLEEAASQQNIVLQTSQALNVAESGHEDKRGAPEVIEGERLLLLATEKRTACLEEVRELKETDSVQYLNKIDTVQPCEATLALTDFKLPLHHEFVNALRQGRMDLGVFHFVIILSCGSKHVYSTKVVSTYDTIEGNNLIIDSNIFMTNVPHDFTLTVRVFGLHTRKNHDHTSRVKKNHVNSQSPSNLKNLFSKKHREDEYISNASPQTVFRTSNFKLVGETKINLNILGSGNKHVLTKVPSNCPLSGFLQVRVGCKPEFTANASGFLTILEDVGGYTAWNRRWCTLKDSKVLYWRYPDDEDTKEPLGCIDLRYCTNKNVSLLSRDKCARPHTFELCTKRSLQSTDVANLITTIEGKYVHIKYWICGDNKDDRVIWMEAINKQLADSRAWILKKNKTSTSSASNDEIICQEKGKAVAV